MNKKALDVAPVTRTSKLDGLKWVVIIILFGAGFWANYYYADIDWALRLVAWIILSCIILGIALQTTLGQKAWVFAKEARGELRKVFWPTRQETIQTTMIIVIMVILMALILWGIDSFLLWIVAGLTGRG